MIFWWCGRPWPADGKTNLWFFDGVVAPGRPTAKPIYVFLMVWSPLAGRLKNQIMIFWWCGRPWPADWKINLWFFDGVVAPGRPTEKPIYDFLMVWSPLAGRRRNQFMIFWRCGRPWPADRIIFDAMVRSLLAGRLKTGWWLECNGGLNRMKLD